MLSTHYLPHHTLLAPLITPKSQIMPTKTPIQDSSPSLAVSAGRCPLLPFPIMQIFCLASYEHLVSCLMFVQPLFFSTHYPREIRNIVYIDLMHFIHFITPLLSTST